MPKTAINTGKYIFQSVTVSTIVCPMAVVPAPPATTVTTPELNDVAARFPATPPLPVIVVPDKIGKEPTTPELTVGALGVESPA